MPTEARTSAVMPKNSKMNQDEAALSGSGSEKTVHGGEADDRLVFVDGPDRVADGWGERCGVAMGADDERLHVVDPRPLRGWNVKGVFIGGCERLLLDVADDADNGGPWPIGVIHVEAHAHVLTDGVLIGKAAGG